MKKYIVTWFNYIAQCDSTEKVKANSYDEAMQLALRIMLAKHPSMHYDEDNISTINEVNDDDYMDEEDVAQYEAQMKTYYQQLNNRRKTH